MGNDRYNNAGIFEIDLLELARALWKNILLIALAAVLFGSAAFGYSVVTLSPQYRATVAMYVNSSTFRFGDTNFAISSGQLSSGSLISIYLYILQSRTTMEEVIEEADLPYSPGALSGMIHGENVSGTAVLEVTVTSSNPAETELIANTIAKVLPRRIADIVDGSSVRIVDYAIIPARRSGPDLVEKTKTGILAGAVVSSALVILFSLLDKKTKAVIRSADELRMMFPDVVVLAQIPDMRRNEKKGYYSAYYGSTNTGKEGHKNGKKRS